MSAPIQKTLSVRDAAWVAAGACGFTVIAAWWPWGEGTSWGAFAVGLAGGLIVGVSEWRVTRRRPESPTRRRGKEWGLTLVMVALGVVMGLALGDDAGRGVFAFFGGWFGVMAAMRRPRAAVEADPDT